MTENQWIEICYINKVDESDLGRIEKHFNSHDDVENFINHHLHNEEYVIKMCSRVNNKKKI